MIKYSSFDFDKIDLPLLQPVESITVAPESIDAKFFLFNKEFKSAWYFDSTSKDFCYFREEFTNCSKYFCIEYNLEKIL